MPAAICGWRRVNERPGRLEVRPVSTWRTAGANPVCGRAAPVYGQSRTQRAAGAGLVGTQQESNRLGT